MNNKKHGAQLVSRIFWRRERDSNPRKLSLQRFSRPPRSTTPPSLHIKFYCLRVGERGAFVVSKHNVLTTPPSLPVAPNFAFSRLRWYKQLICYIAAPLCEKFFDTFESIMQNSATNKSILTNYRLIVNKFLPQTQNHR